ncbi:MAG TPA: hypothetical protein VGL81_37000 [Polyangiaceae bacterium]|jgi:hypothetical protein
MNPTRLVATLVVALSPLALLPATGCGGDENMTGVADAKLPKGASEGLDHESCDESGNRVEILDTNNDGKPDIRRVFDKKSQREICRVVDLNHDGRPDLYEYFDGNGAVRRREFCYDDTGVVNAIEHYDAGRITQREYDTGGQHKIDTWDYFEPGLPIDAKTGRPVHPSRRERDTNGDGHVDQWWAWQGSKVSIARDTTGNGKADPASTVVLDQGAAEVDAGAPVAAARPSDDGGTGAPAEAGPASTVDAAVAASGDGGKR